MNSYIRRIYLSAATVGFEALLCWLIWFSSSFLNNSSWQSLVVLVVSFWMSCSLHHVILDTNVCSHWSWVCCRNVFLFIITKVCNTNSYIRRIYQSATTVGSEDLICWFCWFSPSCLKNPWWQSLVLLVSMCFFECNAPCSVLYWN